MMNHSVAYQEIDQWVEDHFAEQVDFLKSLVQIPTDTPPGNNASASTSASAGVPLFAADGVFRKYTSIPNGYQYTYGNTLTSSSDGGAVSSTHRILGTDAIKFDTHTDASGAKTASLTMTTRGPCLS